MSRFFIRRPIVAMVISILTVIAGAVALQSLPIEQYPSLAPPVVRVPGNYTGANAPTSRSVWAPTSTPRTCWCRTGCRRRRHGCRRA